MRLFRYKSTLLLFAVFIVIFYFINQYGNIETFVASKSTAKVHTKLGEKESTGGLPGMSDHQSSVKPSLLGGGATPVPSGIAGGTEVRESGTTIQFDKYGNIIGTGTVVGPTSGGSGGSTTPAKKQTPITCPNGQPSGGFICCPNGQPSGGFLCCPDGTPSGGKPCKTVT
jgi:hypothetical protein